MDQVVLQAHQIDLQIVIVGELQQATQLVGGLGQCHLMAALCGSDSGLHAAGAAAHDQHFALTLGGGAHAVKAALLSGAGIDGAGQVVAVVQTGETVQAAQAGMMSMLSPWRAFSGK